MAPRKRKQPPNKPPKKAPKTIDKKQKATRASYPLYVKEQARHWHNVEGFKLAIVQEKLRQQGIYAPDNTVCSWWSEKVMATV